MSQEKRRVHPYLHPDHEEAILTSKSYSSIDKFIELARSTGNIMEIDGETRYKNPY